MPFVHEDDAPDRHGLLFQLLVGLVITPELIPVLQLVGQRARGVDQTAVRTGRIEFIGDLRGCGFGRKQTENRHDG